MFEREIYAVRLEHATAELRKSRAYAPRGAYRLPIIVAATLLLAEEDIADDAH